MVDSADSLFNESLNPLTYYDWATAPRCLALGPEGCHDFFNTVWSAWDDEDPNAQVAELAVSDRMYRGRQMNWTRETVVTFLRGTLLPGAEADLSTVGSLTGSADLRRAPLQYLHDRGKNKAVATYTGGGVVPRGVLPTFAQVDAPIDLSFAAFTSAFETGGTRVLWSGVCDGYVEFAFAQPVFADDADYVVVTAGIHTDLAPTLLQTARLASVPKEPLDVLVSLVDGAGLSVGVRCVVAWPVQPARIPGSIVDDSGLAVEVQKAVPQTLRIPLDAFRAMAPTFGASGFRACRLELAAASSGSLWIGDVAIEGA